MLENILITEKLEISTCCICCSECDSDLSALCCGHVFHSPCINEWINQRGFCPICKNSPIGKKHIPLIFEAKIIKIDRTEYFKNVFCEQKENSKIIEQLLVF